jgi:hypothetical protein
MKEDARTQLRLVRREGTSKKGEGSMKLRKNVSSGAIAVLVAASIAASAAQARPLTKSPIAGATPYSEIRSESRADLQSAQGLNALVLRSQGMNERYGHSQSQPSSQEIVSSEGGFDWSDAGIGAGVVLGSVMVIGAAGLSRRRHSHVAT